MLKLTGGTYQLVQAPGPKTGLKSMHKGCKSICETPSQVIAGSFPPISDCMLLANTVLWLSADAIMVLKVINICYTHASSSQAC